MLNESLAPAALPPDLRVYAIGDVHGCDSRLGLLHQAIARDAAARPVPRIVLVHLGDYVDRGPDSAGVIRRLLGPSPVPGAEMVNLRGNHEELLLDGYGPQAVMEREWVWVANGGDKTLLSYGERPESGARDSIPGAHLDFMRALPLTWRAGGYLFVHAGVRPGVAIEAQDPHDLIWIREPFLRSTEDFGAVVVHGHTPRKAVEIRPNRINIDTGAVFGGPLTCLVLEGDRMGFFEG